MNQSALKTFAQAARRKLRDLLGARLDYVLNIDTAELRQQAPQVTPMRNAYPGQPLDGAFLPIGSPLLGRVAGSPQGNTVQALDQTWQLVSYHPHNGGGAPPWNKDKHGFQTYVDELLTWIHRANQ